MRTYNALINNNPWLGHGIEIGMQGRPRHLAQASGMYLKEWGYIYFFDGDKNKIYIDDFKKKKK